MEQLEKLGIERDAFERKAQAVKEQGELDQMDSEKIGFFKANKERIRDELLKLKEGLEDEKQALGDDKVKLQIFRVELKQREKAIEAMRYEYIKTTSGDVRQFSNQAHELGHFQNVASHGGAAQQPERLYPMSTTLQPQQQASPPAPAARPHHATLGAANRFSYDDYMRTLKSRLEMSAPNTGSLSGSSFQQFILKEKQDYLRSVDKHA